MDNQSTIGKSYMIQIAEAASDVVSINTLSFPRGIQRNTASTTMSRRNWALPRLYSINKIT